MRIEFTVASASRAHSSARRWHSSAWSIRRSLPRLFRFERIGFARSFRSDDLVFYDELPGSGVAVGRWFARRWERGRCDKPTSNAGSPTSTGPKGDQDGHEVRGAMAAAYVELGAPNLLFHSASGPLTMWPRGVSYSSWRRHQTPFSLRPRGARSSHWYMPQRPSSPRA